MGCRIGYESEPGLGAIFWFSLPLHEKALITGEAMDHRGNGRVGPKIDVLTPLNILVVEDNHINQQVLSGLIEDLGHQVEISDNGPDAIDTIAAGNFDLVLMDVQMPGMDGMDATREIRRLDGPAGKVPIIAITANSMEGDRETCIEAGMNDFVAKPIDVSLLEKAIIRSQKSEN